MSMRVGIPGVEAPLEDQRAAFDKTLGTGRFEILDHQGSVSDDSLLEKLEYMACVCDYIYLDHITIAISDVDGNTNQAMDKFMSELLKMAKRHNVWFGVVSHLRKSNQDQSSFEQGAEINEDSMKGSGSLKQISAQIIALERNKNAEDEGERHTVKVRVLKDRFGGDTGLAARYKFSFDTGRLRGVEQAAAIADFDNLT
jgi:twinkle protein